MTIAPKPLWGFGPVLWPRSVRDQVQTATSEGSEGRPCRRVLRRLCSSAVEEDRLLASNDRIVHQMHESGPLNGNNSRYVGTLTRAESRSASTSRAADRLPSSSLPRASPANRDQRSKV